MGGKKKGQKEEFLVSYLVQSWVFRPVLNATFYPSSSKLSPSEQFPQPNPIHPVLKQVFGKKKKSNLDLAFQLNQIWDKK